MTFLPLSFLLVFFYVVFGRKLPRATDIDRPGPHVDTAIEKSEVTIGIALNSVKLDDVSSLLLSLSDPNSESYGKFWSKQDIKARFAPSQVVLRDTVRWIHQAHIPSQKVQKTGNILYVSGSISQLQKLLGADVSHYIHKHAGARTVGFESYRIPANLKGHISSVFVVEEPQHELKRKSTFRALKKSPREVDDCTTKVTPECLRKVNKIPFGNFSHPDNSFGVFLPGWSTWIPDDLDGFFTEYCPELVGHRPEVVPINNGFRQTDIKSDPFNLEPNLDMEYTMSLAYPQSVINFEVGDSEHPGNLNTMLAAFSDSYCSDLNEEFDPIEGILNLDCGTVDPPKVLSISYVWSEASFPREYQEHQCMEFLKLGLQGVTVIVSSGDAGPARHPDGACDNSTRSEGSEGSFVPAWPASCPWVTVVGGTGFERKENEQTATSWRNQPSTGLHHPPITETVYAYFDGNRTSSSGGGFSNTFPIPEYQAEHVRRYLDNQSLHLNPISSLFNSSGRAYPDVAAAATSVQVFTGGRFASAYGTSSSTPVFAAVIAKINNERLRAGKSPVGFINPVLYANMEAFRDVTEGHNSGCGVDEAFRADEGWDPVTGLGGLDYERLLDVFMSLD